MLALFLCVAGFGSIARSEVVHSTADGFELKITKRIGASPKRVYRTLTDDVGDWWDPAHTYSGDSKNLTIEAHGGGYFREHLPEGGSVRHMDVVYADSRKTTLRMRGGLGPLQEHAISGAMTITVAESDHGSELTLVYRVGGYVHGGLGDWAEPVDGVVEAQMQRLKAFIENGRVP